MNRIAAGMNDNELKRIDFPGRGFTVVLFGNTYVNVIDYFSYFFEI
jgi:hypothetical protein